MVPVLALWLPIVLSAVLVFVVSSVLHMVLSYHRNDFRQVPDEDRVMEALRPFRLAPGDYIMPYAGTPEAMKSAEFQERLAKGPFAMMTVYPSRPVSMGRSLLLWFVYTLVVGWFAAYITGRALGPGAAYLSVFRFVCTAAFLGYSLALVQQSIWYGRPWSTTLKSVFDGLIYALVTAGVFGWLWPV